MRTFAFLTALYVVCVMANAQETGTEMTNISNVIDDAKANSDSVPSGYTIPGSLKRIKVFRFKYQTDLLSGIDSLARKEKIRNGVILAGIGSVRNYRYHIVGNRTFPLKEIFVSNTEGAADIASMNGYIIDGRVHAHIVFSDRTHAFGGHLEKGTNVFTFAIITIGALDDAIDLKSVDDKSYR